MIMPVFAQESPLSDVSSQLEYQINEDNLRELESKLSDIESKLDKNETNYQVNATIVYDQLAKFEMNLNSCQQNVTDNCKQVESKLNNIEQELEEIKNIISKHTSGSDTQWINGLNITLAVALLSLSITALIIARTNYDKMKLEKKLDNHFDKIKSILKPEESTDTTHTENTTDEKKTYELKEEEINELKEEETKLDDARILLENNDYDDFIRKYNEIKPIDDILKINPDKKYLNSILQKHFRIVFSYMDMLREDPEDMKLKEIRSKIFLKIGVGVQA